MWDECCSVLLPIPWPRSLHTGCLAVQIFSSVFRVFRKSNGGSKCKSQNQPALYIFHDLLGLEPWIHVGLQCEWSLCIFSDVTDFNIFCVDSTSTTLLLYLSAAIKHFGARFQSGLQCQAQDFHISQLPGNHQTNQIGASSRIVHPAPFVRKWVKRQ